MVLIERCKTCKNNWDGHCIVGNDIWKMKNSNKEVECEEYKKYKEAYEDDPLFKIKPLPLGKTNSSQIYESFEELAGKYLRTQQVLKEIFELLEKHQPPWYLRKHYNLICELLE